VPTSTIFLKNPTLMRASPATMSVEVIEEELEELAGERAVDVTPPEEAAPERADPELPELSGGISARALELAHRRVSEIPKRVSRRASQMLYERMGYIE
jgi:hypothetical protein